VFSGLARRLRVAIGEGNIGVLENALETAGLMLGTDKSRGYYLEMTRADSIAGANPPEA
jgi:hypothetical protein